MNIEDKIIDGKAIADAMKKEIAAEATIEQGFSGGIKIGILSILDLMSIISISLFIMNLLPIPILDGGLILVALIEAITRKKISPKLQYYIQFIGVAFIIFMLILAVSSDFTYFFKGKN